MPDRFPKAVYFERSVMYAVPRRDLGISASGNKGCREPKKSAKNRRTLPRRQRAVDRQLDPNSHLFARRCSEGSCRGHLWLRSRSLADSLVAPPSPHCPQWGLRSNPKAFRSLNCQEPSSSFVVQLAPLRASPASASLLRDLLTAVTPSKRLPTFAFVILFARSSLQ
jgi:hypothetical protein